MLLVFLYKYSYISLDPIKSILYFGDFKIIFLITFFSFSCSFFLYLRFIYCLEIYSLKSNIFNLIQVNSQAYSYASFVPGQIGIDAWRIGKLRKLDFTKFKTKLIKSTILEKVMALLSQIFVLFFFIINNSFNRFLLLLFTMVIIYLITFLSKEVGFKFNSIKKFTSNLNFRKISFLFFICVIANFISCYLIKFIAIAFMMDYPLKVMSISSILSNIVGVIPISPNGLGISEFVFSEVTQNISNSNSNNAIATIYFCYRILILFTHFLIFFTTKTMKIIKERNKLF